MKELDLEAALAVAFRFLGYSARSTAEIRSRLERDEFPEEIVAQVVEQLQAQGYVNDSEFAQHWIADRADRKKYGRNRLASELNRKGIDRDTAESALEAVDDEDEFRRALQAAEPRWARVDTASLDATAQQKEKTRLSAFLSRRGFSWDTIKKVLAALAENNR